ncbi:MAG TPA: hypothetical protein VKB26_12395 [Candidatus Acidoferrales bacterium]|nr:hypothetical protein [Candidatus Acidoferrales bacterium]
MNKRISRRDLLKTSLAAGVTSLVPLDSHAALDSGEATNVKTPAVDNVGFDAADEGGILPLTCTSGVYIPPRGQSFFKFSFDFPEPSLTFQGMQFSFRLSTFENAYGLDRDSMKVEQTADGLQLRCSQFVWAGGQQKAAGNLLAQFRKDGDFVEWSASAEMDRPIKSITAIVRGVPRGKVAGGSGGFFDPGENELLLGYPFGAGDHHTARGIDSPLAIVRAGEQEFFFLSTLLTQVRACRIYLQPGDEGYRAELVYEQEGWRKSNRLQSATWRAGRTTTAEQAYRPHFEHVGGAFQIPAWEQRQDVPSWFREISLVVSIHGMHWTGYVFNDFAKSSSILDWVATQISPKKVMVFLPAWDGRYYWDYPVYRPEPRLGGEEGLRALIQKGHRMGFHFLPMFGMNAADKHLEIFSKFSDATTEQIDGNDFDLDWVDWDNDRHNEGTGKYMNLGVQSWQDWLFGRIADIVQRFDVDGYFLDISGGWVNNTKADMHEGTRRLVANLRERFPHVLAVGEFSYDALMSVLPVYQVFPSRGYPAAFQKYARTFEHLSFPAPGRGSSGVHESGFGRFRPNVSKDQPVIPTITVVDDTFEKYRDVMAQTIQEAKAWTGMDWKG